MSSTRDRIEVITNGVAFRQLPNQGYGNGFVIRILDLEEHRFFTTFTKQPDHEPIFWAETLINNCGNPSVDIRADREDIDYLVGTLAFLAVISDHGRDRTRQTAYIALEHLVGINTVSISPLARQALKNIDYRHH